MQHWLKVQNLLILPGPQGATTGATMRAMQAVGSEAEQLLAHVIILAWNEQYIFHISRGPVRRVFSVRKGVKLVKHVI